MFIDSGVGKWTRALGSLVFLQLKVCFESFVTPKFNSSPDSQTVHKQKRSQPSAVASACNVFSLGAKKEGWPLLYAQLVIMFELI